MLWTNPLCIKPVNEKATHQTYHVGADLQANYKWKPTEWINQLTMICVCVAYVSRIFCASNTEEYIVIFDLNDWVSSDETTLSCNFAAEHTAGSQGVSVFVRVEPRLSVIHHFIVSASQL